MDAILAEFVRRIYQEFNAKELFWYNVGYYTLESALSTEEHARNIIVAFARKELGNGTAPSPRSPDSR